MGAIRPENGDRERMAYHLAPALQQIVEHSGSYQTLLDAHSALADPDNDFEVDTPAIGDIGAAAGLIIIITS